MANTKEDTLSVTVKHEIPRERVEDLLCSALEGGIGYWAMIIDKKRVPEATYTSELPMRGGSFSLGDVDGAEFDPVDFPGVQPLVDRAACERGFQVMADKYPHHMARFLDETDDAETGDVFVQCCVFGEIVFG